jgi:hypothetical protein
MHGSTVFDYTRSRAVPNRDQRRDRHKCKRRSRQHTNASCSKSRILLDGFSECTKTQLSQRVYTSLSVSMFVEPDDSPGPGQTEESIMVCQPGVWRAFFSSFDWKCRLNHTSLLVAPWFIAALVHSFMSSSHSYFQITSLFRQGKPRTTLQPSFTKKVHLADATVNHVSVRNNHQYDQCHQEQRHHHTRPAR